MLYVVFLYDSRSGKLVPVARNLPEPRKDSKYESSPRCFWSVAVVPQKHVTTCVKLTI